MLINFNTIKYINNEELILLFREQPNLKFKNSNQEIDISYFDGTWIYNLNNTENITYIIKTDLNHFCFFYNNSSLKIEKNWTTNCVFLNVIIFFFKFIICFF